MLHLTRKQVREVDRIAIEEYGIPGVVLMENAARGATDIILQTTRTATQRQSAILFCGKGNNGGDGFAIARHLVNRGWHQQIALCCEPNEISGDALINFRVIERMRVPCKPWPQFTAADVSAGTVVIDAIFGTGFRPPSKLSLQAISTLWARQQVHVVAIDIPSGMDADTGEVVADNAIRAERTITFVAEKTGFAAPSARRYTGQIHVVDIGAPREILDRMKDIA